MMPYFSAPKHVIVGQNDTTGQFVVHGVVWDGICRTGRVVGKIEMVQHSATNGPLYGLI